MTNGFLQDTQQTSQKPRNIKAHNQRLVVGLLQQNETLTATEISERTNLSKTSAIRILAELVEKKLVEPAGKGASTTEGGKRPELFSLNGLYATVIVAHFGVSNLECALLDMRCNILEKRTAVYTDRTDYGQCLAQLVECIEALAQSGAALGAKPASVALGCQGVVDSAAGTLCYTTHSRWGTDIPLRGDIAAALSFKARIIVENVCRFAGYAELLRCPELAEEAIFTITAERTAGGCILDHGTLVEGANGFIGEVGHMMVEPSATQPCICGGHGCFEMMVSPKALREAAAASVAAYPRSALCAAIETGTLQSEDIFAAAEAGDEMARALLDRSAHYFALLAQNIILLCDPQRIVIQGLYAEAGGYFAEKLHAMVVALPFFAIKHNLQIMYSPLEYFPSVFLGGAFYAVNQMLSDGSLFC